MFILVIIYSVQHIQQIDLTLNDFRLLADITAFPSSAQPIYGPPQKYYVNYYIPHIDAYYSFNLNLRLL